MLLAELEQATTREREATDEFSRLARHHQLETAEMAAKVAELELALQRKQLTPYRGAAHHQALPAPAPAPASAKAPLKNASAVKHVSFAKRDDFAPRFTPAPGRWRKKESPRRGRR